MKNYLKWIWIFVLLPFTAMGQEDQVEEWKLLEARDGVEFYTMPVKSKFSNTTSTILKLKNTNGFQVEVAYTPVFTCQEAQHEKPEEKYFLKALDESVMTTYKVCTELKPKLEIKRIVVTRR